MTIMARTRSLSSIETEISKVTAELQKAQEKVDELTQRLLELQEQKQSIEVKQIMDAFRRSGKSMQELLTFLDVCLVYNKNTQNCKGDSPKLRREIPQ